VYATHPLAEDSVLVIYGNFKECREIAITISMKGRPHTFENVGFKKELVSQGKTFSAFTCA
jgi:hypothetical protein